MHKTPSSPGLCDLAQPTPSVQLVAGLTNKENNSGNSSVFEYILVSNIVLLNVIGTK